MTATILAQAEPLGRLEPDEQGGTPRLVFANQLRGVAALSVVASHLLAVFWWARDFLAAATATPVQPGAPPGFATLTANPWFQPGPFGVALFFLISGLVIPFSLDRHRTGSFLLARVLRIYPTYLAALLIELAVLHLNGWLWNRPFPHGGETILGNALLIHNLFGLGSIDLVNWTLCIELKFYLLAALLAAPLRRGTSWMPIAAAAALAGLALALRAMPPGPVPDTLRIEIPYLVFMLIGTLFTLRLHGRLPVPALLAAMTLLLVAFVYSWRLGPQAGQYPIVLFNYGYALVLFSGCFLLRRWIRPFWPLDRLADISFPIYLVHLVVGTSVMKLALLRFGWSPGLSLLAALAVVLGIAVLLHRLIERRSIAAGRALARRKGGT